MEDRGGPGEAVEIGAGGVGEALDVAESEVFRVGEVHVGVGQPIEDQRPPIRVGTIDLDGDAVVGTLRVAGRGARKREAAHGDGGDGQDPAPGEATSPQAQP